MTSKSMFGCLRIFQNSLLSTQNRFSTHRSVNGVKIPERIERGPTDILQALSKTVSLSHISYKMQYGILWNDLNNFENKLISMGFESGRKAAKWIVSENPNFFQHRIAEPYIEAFAPPKVLDDTSEVSEETLINAIHMIHVKYAIDVYNLLKVKGIDVSKATKQKLLELVCYFNCANKPDVTMVEAKYNNIRDKSEWKEDDFHMQLFEEMEPNAQSYSAVILGCFKHNNNKLGVQLFKEAETKGIKFGTDVHNEILGDLRNGEHKYFSPPVILRKFKEMAELKIEPNLGTLNKTLRFMAGLKNFQTEDFALKVVNEFRRIGINPSLGTYYYLMTILFGKESEKIGHPVNIFIEILNEIQDKSFEIEDEVDCQFFPKAMEKAYEIKRLDLAIRLDKILNTGSNRVLIRNTSREVKYYRCFLLCIFEFGRPEEIFDLFASVVSVWKINEYTYVEILWALNDRSDGGKYLQIIWDNIRKLRKKSLMKCADQFLILLDQKGYQMDNNKDLKIAKEMWDDFPIDWDSMCASRVMAVFCRKKEKKYAYEVLDYILNKTVSVIELDLSSSIDFIKLCAVHNDKEKALEFILRMCKNKFLYAHELITCLQSNFKLDKDDWSKLRVYKDVYSGENDDCAII